MVYWWFIKKNIYNIKPIVAIDFCLFEMILQKIAPCRKIQLHSILAQLSNKLNSITPRLNIPVVCCRLFTRFLPFRGGIKSRIFNEFINYLMIFHAILPFLCLLFTESLKEEIMTSGIVDIARQLSCHEEEKVREAANTFVAVLEEAPLERWTEQSTKMYRTSEWLSLCCWVEIRQTEIEWVLMPKCETWTPASKEHL